MKFFRLLLIALFAVSLSFCGEKKETDEAPPPDADILSSEEMVTVLEDIYLAEGAVNRKEITAESPRFYASNYYTFVLSKHNITKAQFMDSYVYYSGNAEEMVKILEAIINDLSEKQGVLQGTATASGVTEEKAE